MNHVLKHLTLGVLYILVALLIAVPPVYLIMSAPGCVAEPCQISSRFLFTAHTASIWLLPFSIAAVLLALIFKLKSRA